MTNLHTDEATQSTRSSIDWLPTSRLIKWPINR